MDALELIAEAQAQKAQAEHDRNHWKQVAESRARRVSRIIDSIKGRNFDSPPITPDGRPYWKQTHEAVQRFAEVLRDPYARFGDPDEWDGETHDQAIDMLTWRIQDLIAAAIARDRDERKEWVPSGTVMRGGHDVCHHVYQRGDALNHFVCAHCRREIILG